MYRRTKIVATLGPACSEKAQLRELLKAGVNVFRLNFSHGGYEQKEVWIRQLRQFAAELNITISILGDLQGPKIRTGMMQNGSQKLDAGQKVIITTADIEGANGLIPTSYEDLPNDVVPGDQILLDDGRLELEVLRILSGKVHCLVKVGGLLKDRKGINLPGVKVSAPAMTTKDFDDLQFAIEQELDWIALSFVRTASEVSLLKKKLQDQNSGMKVIAKIEKPEAVTNFSAILAVTDGVMVARGDLGVEVPSEHVPLIQKRIIRECNQQGKPVITATQMLESIISQPRPTRAETSDVANAILDGTDAVMLSGETAAGLYPIEAVRVMDRIARDVETEPALGIRVNAATGESLCPLSHSDAIGKVACHLSETIGAAAILAFTQTGSTAALIAKYRPSLPIIAVTPNRQVKRQLALYRGVHPLLVLHQGNTEAQILSVETAVLDGHLLQPGDVVVITMGIPLSAPGTTNMLKVHQLERHPESPQGQ
ncbi:pyruvate kinase [Desulfuromusa kysingii]|uniref:Pyruvate kinase n=1 Tax=Desulfuromusa kysingii TaxID=37625 RepID=A0A1H4DN38_9BACT|nr:pyruvate kinase [Desulfuromusa kysingii]SEA74203.1 pyruvate kinase [Desulfuromusa kysingii]